MTPPENPTAGFDPLDEADPEFDPLRALLTAPSTDDRDPDHPERPAWAGEVITLLADIRDELRRSRPAYFTTAEFARRCGVTAGTVRRWVRAGKVTGVRRWVADRARLLVPAAELDRLVPAGRAAGPEADPEAFGDADPDGPDVG